MYGLVVGGHAGLLERLGHGGVRVAGARDVLAARVVLERDDGLGDHLAGVRAEDVSAEDAVGSLVGEDFDEALGGTVRAGAGVRGEGEVSDDVVDSGLLELCKIRRSRRVRILKRSGQN